MMACLSVVIRCDNINRGAVCCYLGANTGTPGPASEQQSQVMKHARWLCPSDTQTAQRRGLGWHVSTRHGSMELSEASAEHMVFAFLPLKLIQVALC